MTIKKTKALAPGEPEREHRKPPHVVKDLGPQRGERRVPLLGLRTGDCRYPIGEPAGDEEPVAGRFLFCGASVVPGRRYCAGHAALAYVPIPGRKLDAAPFKLLSSRPKRAA